MWPMLLDYTKDESKRILRRLELEAYASVISVFRAQGDLNKDKKSILQDLQQTLSISTERHRAEVRRAVNDEKLATIADNISGSMGTEEWLVEGRRLVPLMPRLVPQTVFTSTANQAARAMMEKNACLPPPASTWNKEGPSKTVPKPTRSSSPSSNVVVLPSGTSIHIKGMLRQEDNEEDLSSGVATVPTSARRSSQRSLSTDSQNAGSSVSTQTPRAAYSAASGAPTTQPGASSPVKITISKSAQGRPVNVQSNSQPPKVILVTSAGQTPAGAHRSMSVPGGSRNQPNSLAMSTGYAGYPMSSSMGHAPPISTPRSSVLVSGAGHGPPMAVSAGHQGMPSHPGPNTTFSNVNISSAMSSVGGNPALFNPALQGLGKIRPRIVPRQRYPAMVSPPPQPSKPGAVVPMGPQLTSPLPQHASSTHPLAVHVSGTSSQTPSYNQQAMYHAPQHHHHQQQHSVGSSTVSAPYHTHQHHYQGPPQHQHHQPQHLSSSVQMSNSNQPPATVSTEVGSNLPLGREPPASNSGTQGTQALQVKTLGKPTIQIKQEGGMKIITQGTSSKILPKPSQISGTGGPPVVMVGQSGHPSSTTSITMLPRSISTYTAHSGGKVLNITTPGGRVIATTTKATNVVTVNPKTLHLTAVKSGSVSKPNVIVVQKTQHARFQTPLGGNIRTVTTSNMPGAIDKELMGLVHHKDAQGRHILTASNPGSVNTSAAAGRPGERRVIITTSGGGGEPVSIIHRGRADSDGKTSSLLAELIQAAGIMPTDSTVETVAQGTDPFDFDNQDGEQRIASQHTVVTTPSSQVVFRQAPATLSQQHHMGVSDWPHGSLLEDKGSSQDSDSGTEQVFTLEQAMSMLNKEVVDLTETDLSSEVVVQPSMQSVTSSTKLANPTVTVSATPAFQIPATVTSLSSATSLGNAAPILPNILNSVALDQPGLLSQPKVSILAKSKLLGSVVKDSKIPMVLPMMPGHVTVGSGNVGAAIPTDGLREGQLDTQTGLFYQVTATASPAPSKSKDTQMHSITVSPPLPPRSPATTLPSSVVVVAAVTNASATKTSTTSSSISAMETVHSQHRLSHVVTQTGHIPASVTTTSPLTVISAKLPPSTTKVIASSYSSLTTSTFLSKGLTSTPPPLPVSSTLQPIQRSLSLSSSSSAAAKGAAAAARAVATSSRSNSFTAPLQPDLLSSSLAQADISFEDEEDATFNLDNSDQVGSSIAEVVSIDHRFMQDQLGPDLFESKDGDGVDIYGKKDMDSGHLEGDNVVYDMGDKLGLSPEVDQGVESSLFQPLTQHVSFVASTTTADGCRPGMAEVLREETAKDGTVILTVFNPASSHSEISNQPNASITSSTSLSSSTCSATSLSTELGPTLVSLPSQLSRVSPSSLPAVSPSTNRSFGQLFSVLEAQNSQTLSVRAPVSTVTNSKAVLLTQTSSVLPTSVKTASLPAPVMKHVLNARPGQTLIGPQSGVIPVAVTVEPPASVITLNLDNLNGQQVVVPQGEVGTNTDIHLDDTGSAGSDPDSQVEDNLIRSSKRKRKHNSGYDELPTTTSPNSWTKAAAGLLIKVARFKGSTREKSDIPAAEWFTYPVDPTDAPDYYTVIQQPMDFSTMRKKLETGQYSCFEEFQSDMDLIRKNCYLYNSEGTKVRQDCDEVMAFYGAELLKMQSKQVLSQYPSPMKKPKEDKSPQK